MAYDEKCYELAAYFHEGDTALTKDLAQTIQDAVEAWVLSNSDDHD